MTLISLLRNRTPSHLKTQILKVFSFISPNIIKMFIVFNKPRTLGSPLPSIWNEIDIFLFQLEASHWALVKSSWNWYRSTKLKTRKNRAWFGHIPVFLLSPEHLFVLFNILKMETGNSICLTYQLGINFNIIWEANGSFWNAAKEDHFTEKLLKIGEMYIQKRNMQSFLEGSPASYSPAKNSPKCHRLWSRSLFWRAKF